MIICAFENSPSIPSFLVTKIVYIEYGQLKKKDSFSFYLSIAVLLVFLYLIAAYASVGQCVIIICRCPQNILKYLSGHPSIFAVSTVLHLIISKQDIQIC
jgi:hypothetical protein